MKANGWSSPDPSGYPTGADIVEQYLTPLAQLGAIAPHVRLNHKVIGVTRQGVDKLRDDDREDRPFIVTTSDPAGVTRIPVRAVIDATGTWLSPNPVGTEGIPAFGEEEARQWISYGIPDVLNAERGRYAGRRVAVVGSGHSAKHAVRELSLLAEQDPATTVTWIVRGRGSTGLRKRCRRPTAPAGQARRGRAQLGFLGSGPARNGIAHRTNPCR